jgi:hypothetical protein
MRLLRWIVTSLILVLGLAHTVLYYFGSLCAP